jgi:hypothetical protein
MGTAPQHKFVSALQRKRGVYNGRKRYRMTDRLDGPHGFLFMSGSAPEGEPEDAWLGKSVFDLRGLLDSYREVKK